MQSEQAGGENGGQLIEPLIRSHFGGALVVAQDGPPCRWVVGNFEPLSLNYPVVTARVGRICPNTLSTLTVKSVANDVLDG